MAFRPTPLPLVLAVALPACVGPVPVPQPAARPAARTAARSPQPPAASARALPGGPSPAALATSPGPGASEEVAVLRPPAGAHRVLTGSVTIDGPYALRAGGARLLSEAGGSVLLVGPALLAGLGGNVIANHGGGVVAGGGGNVVANQGGAVIANGGGTVLANGGGGLLAAGGVALVAPYGLAQAGALAIGEVLPAAGVLVTARALATGAPVALGVGPGEQPVTTIRTDAAGRFRVFLLEATENVVVEARLTNAQGVVNGDPRLAYDVFAGRDTAEAPLDEDGTVATEVIRLATQGTLAAFVVTGDVTETMRQISSFPPGVSGQLATVVRELREASRASGLDGAAPAELEAVTTRMAEALVGRVDLGAQRISQLYVNGWGGPEELAMPALLDVLRRGREASTARLREDPAFFDQQPYVTAINATRPTGAERWEIRKPGDVNRFVVRECVATKKPIGATVEVFQSIGLTEVDARRVYATINTFIGASAVVLFANEAGARDEQLAIIRGWRTLVGRPGAARLL
ncbi:MAG: hypothetical protein VKS61_14615 [Candidatus Sericytochromatia bacterium]|nr:hypothetical protein [Candidatus Sericytochromatia bacterium]